MANQPLNLNEETLLPLVSILKDLQFIDSDKNNPLEFLRLKIQSLEFGSYSQTVACSRWSTWCNKNYVLVLFEGVQYLYKK